jgi:PEP-CTERM motif
MGQVLRIAAVIAVFALISVSAAKADSNTELYYSLTGPGGVTASFYLPVNPVIAPENVDGTFAFQVSPIDVMLNGKSDPDGGYVTFYDISFGGGLTLDQGEVFDLTNPDDSNIALFTTGTEAAPMMLAPTGNIPLDDFMSGDGGYNLTVTQVQVTTPEPASLLLVGVGLIALIAMKRRLTVTQ